MGRPEPRNCAAYSLTDLNHEIRNGLQVIACHNAAKEGAAASPEVNAAVGQIETALRGSEVLLTTLGATDSDQCAGNGFSSSRVVVCGLQSIEGLRDGERGRNRTFNLLIKQKPPLRGGYVNLKLSLQSLELMNLKRAQRLERASSRICTEHGSAAKAAYSLEGFCPR